MEIKLPSIKQQQRVIFEEATKAGIKQLKANLKAPEIGEPLQIDEGLYPRTHLLREREGYEPPAPEIVKAYFAQLQAHSNEHGSDKKLARLLGVSSDRRVREFKSGESKVPYGIWRRFLVLTGRAPQEIVEIIGFMR